MDTPTPSLRSTANAAWRGALGGAAALALMLLFLLPGIHALLGSTPSSTLISNQTTIVEQRTFSRTLRLTGTTQAARSFIVIAPRLEGAQLPTLLITHLVPSGSRVKKGELLVEFDPQAQMKDFLDKQNQYTALLGQLAQKKAEEEIAKAKDESALEQATSDRKKAELEVQKNEIVSRIDAEKNQETLAESKATLEQLKDTFQLKRKAANAAIRILDLQRERAEQAMRYARSNAKKMSIKSPMDGVAVFNMIWLGGRMGTVQTGDSVRSGAAFMQVVDPSQMEVLVPVNQADFSKIRRGQAATIHLDAYPAMTLPATVTEISPLAEQGKFSDKVRTFSALFQIRGDDPRLLPDLSAAVDIELARNNGALVVPLQSIGHEGSSDYVWVKDGAGFSRRQVRVGERNDMDAVILSGVTRGDVIRASAPQPGAATP